VVAVALEVEQFRLSPARKKGDDEGALPHYLGAAKRKVPMHEDLKAWVGVPDLWDLARGGSLLRGSLSHPGEEGVGSRGHPIDEGNSH
jgi:hypothetical protein